MQEEKQNLKAVRMRMFHTPLRCETVEKDAFYRNLSHLEKLNDLIRPTFKIGRGHKHE